MIINSIPEFILYLNKNKPIIGIDYGIKKIGIAISNPDRTIAMPIYIIKQNKQIKQIESIIYLIQKYSICGLVIGLPIKMNGEHSLQTEISIKFSKILSNITKLPIYLQDERLTSIMSNNYLKFLGLKRKKRHRIEDSIAANFILDTTLECIKRLN